MPSSSPSTRSESSSFLPVVVSVVTGLGGWLLASVAPSGGTKEQPKAQSAAQAGQALTTTAPPVAATPTAQPSSPAKPEFSRRAAFDRIVEEENDQRKFAALEAELENLPASEFPLAIADLLGRAHKGSGLAALVAGVWAERDLESAREWMLTNSVTYSAGFEQAILGVWSRSDPKGMLQWLHARAGRIQPSKKDDLAFAVCKVAAKTDPDGGLAWIRSHQPDRIQSFYMCWAQWAPDAAAARVLTESDIETRNNSIAMIASFWAGAERDPTAAAAWAQRLPDPLLVNQALTSIGSRVSRKDSRAGADFFAALPQTNAVRASLKDVIATWSAVDLSAAFAWSLDLPDEPLAVWSMAALAPKVPRETVAAIIAALPEERRALAEARWARAKPSPAIPLPPP